MAAASSPVFTPAAAIGRTGGLPAAHEVTFKKQNAGLLIDISVLLALVAMPTYRVYYVERVPREGELAFEGLDAYRGRAGDYVSETEWEEDVEGRNVAAALDSFFRDHAGSEVRLLDEDGTARTLSAAEGYDADRTYIWIEGGKLMEYQGLVEGTPGMVACPLCEGTGEVTEEAADEYLAAWGEEEEE